MNEPFEFAIRQPRAFADVDLGEETFRNGLADLWWQQENATTRGLVPKDKSVFAIWNDGSEPSHDDCLGMAKAAGWIDASAPAYGQMPAGTWICAETSDRRIVVLEALSIDPASGHLITFDFTTWEQR